MDKQPDLIVDPDDTATFFYQSGTYTPDQSIGFLMRRVLSSILQAADAQLAEQGLTDAPYRMSGWAGFIAPAATPKPIIDKLAAAIHTAMADPAIQKRIRDMGFEPTLDSSPAKNMERYKHDVPIWKNLIELADAKIQ